MAKWEYRCLFFDSTADDIEAWEDLLNELGNVGWEMVSFIEHRDVYISILKYEVESN